MSENNTEDFLKDEQEDEIAKSSEAQDTAVDKDITNKRENENVQTASAKPQKFWDKVKTFVGKNKKPVIISAVLLVVMIALSVSIPLGIAYAPLKGTPSTYAYNKDANFDLNTDGYVLRKKDDNKDFKVLNIADLQMSEFYTIFQNNRNYELVERLVKQEQPDLLTFTGDNFWLGNSKNATKRFIKNIDKLGVPWAPVFGNHEPESEVDKNWIMEQFLTAENCIFKYGENSNRKADLAKGPNNIDGVGNYVINILDSDSKIVHTVFMMDSHSNNADQDPDRYNKPSEGTPISGLEGWFTNGRYMYRPYTAEELKENKNLSGYKAVGTNYDYIKQNQIEWYKWAVGGITKANGGVVVQSSAYFHIALPEFNIAYAIYEKNLPENYDGRRVIGTNQNFGLNREQVCCAYYNSGFFDVIKELESTKDVVVGHDHVNNSSILYDGIRLTYALKTGDGCYWDESGTVSGGTTISINSKGGTLTRHVYMPFK